MPATKPPKVTAAVRRARRALYELTVAEEIILVCEDQEAGRPMWHGDGLRPEAVRRAVRANPDLVARCKINDGR
jgi:hypothetical protein